jgi:hypothetical protein
MASSVYTTIMPLLLLDLRAAVLLVSSILSTFDLLDHHRRDALAATLQTEEGVVFTQFSCIGMNDPRRDVVDVVVKQSYGKSIRDAKGLSYLYFSVPANICMQAPVGGAPTVDRVSARPPCLMQGVRRLL